MDNTPGGNVVLLEVYSHDMDALMAQGALEENGIPSIIDNGIFSRIYPIGFNSLGGVRLMVLERDLARARQIIAALKPQ